MTHITVIIGAPKAVEAKAEGEKKAPKSARRNAPAVKKAAKAAKKASE